MESLKPCKKLLFGLEICADHANERLNKALVEQKIPDGMEPIKRKEIEELNAAKAKVKLDLQLLPSAGMFPVHKVYRGAQRRVLF